MNQFQNRKLTVNAQKLRREMTKEERHLWYDFLKSLPVTVHRQKVLGKHIADFYIPQEKLIIELDGSQHYEPEHQRRDVERDTYFAAAGMTVLRYANSDVNLNFSGVCEDILNHIVNSEPSF